ncbi:MAG TPA: AarF/UbiB family protein [Fluviicola sp.]|nr:AarF/UbiB family protein [Fluviicola sp.]
MWIFRFNQYIRNVLRLLTIIFIIVGHYIRNWLTTGPLRKIFDPKGKHRMSRPERLRLIIEDLGPTFIKFGQILADRPDLASESLRVELKKLQTAARPFDDDMAMNIIEHELGDNLDDIFASINREHIASASIGQVYRGTLITGEEVIIKVQRPAIKEKIKLDLILIQLFAKKLQSSYPELNTFNLVNFIQDFGEIILKELDFTNEVSNMLRLKNMFKNDHRCHIPTVYNRYCTPRLLIMEYIDGDHPDNVTSLREKGYSPQAIAENGVNVVLTMILRYGFFHADPHPGNIFIRGDNQIVLIDHGMCASMKPKQINGLIDFLIGFADHNSHKIAKALLALMEVQNFREMENLEFEIDELIHKYSYLEYGQVDISGLFNDTFRVMIRYEIKIPTSVYMLLKTLVTIQNLAELLESKISLVDMIRPFAKEKIQERFSWDNIKSTILNSAEDYLYLVSTLPKDIRQIVTDFKTNGLQHKITLGDKGTNNRDIRGHVYRLGTILLIGFMLVCSTMLMLKEQNPSGFTNFFFYSTITLSIIVLIRMAIRTT